jgi:ABC-type antimicrobial peptide transport system ATPase subunit
MTLLAIEGLTIGFQGDGGTATVVEDLDLTLDAGNVLGIVGESGCSTRRRRATRAAASASPAPTCWRSTRRHCGSCAAIGWR